ncbi:MAG TPA: T9SS type A sorting domain-containing protein, partial [candidate division WOR-3 bacterium]|nr:T9SS type A sorting domain-containing protein [candidate division WOR-3 bacterium]
YYNIESYFDGGNVKISADGGNTFTILTPFDGYPEDEVYSGNCFIPGEPAFSGTYVAWRKDYFDLSDYAGDTVIIAFDFGSDNSVTYAGWYINWVKIWSTVPVEVGEKEQILPGKVALHEAVPNPTTGITSISFSLPRSMEVDLSVYDATGRLVRNLISGEVKAGTHTVTWNGRDGYYRKVPNGVYFLRLRAGSATESRKLLLIR